MAKKKAKKLQDNFDFVIQEFGQIDNLYQFLRDNNLGVNDKLNKTDIYIVNNQNDGNIINKNFFKNSTFTIVNFDETDLASSVGDFNNDFSDDFNI